MSADPAVLEYAEPKRPLAIPSQRTEEDNARLPRRAVDFGWRFHAKPIRLLPESSLSLFPEERPARNPRAGGELGCRDACLV